MQFYHFKKTNIWLLILCIIYIVSISLIYWFNSFPFFFLLISSTFLKFAATSHWYSAFYLFSYFPVFAFKTGFLNHGTITILASILFVGGSCPVHCRLFNSTSIFNPYMLVYPPVESTKKKSLLVENLWIKAIHFPLNASFDISSWILQLMFYNF